MTPDGRTWRSVAAVVSGIGAAGVVLLVVIYASITRDIVFGIFTGDSQRAVVDDWYAGLLSDLGLLIWGVGAVASLVAAFVQARRGGRDVGFFVVIGLVTAWLAADDAFLWHEEWIPDTLGVGERAIFATYGFVTLLAVGWGRRVIARNLWWVFTAGGVLLAGSIVVDRTGFPIGASGDIVSVLKFMGIATWTAFFVEAAVHQIGRRTLGITVSESPSWPAPQAGDAIGRQNKSG